MLLSLLRPFLFVSVLVHGFALVSCKRTNPESSDASAAPQFKEPVSTLTDKPTEAVSLRVEALTAAHTRAVWSHHIGTGTPDPFCNGASHQLQGLDTRDGKGVRTLLEKRGNYSRPLITPDGSTILFTEKVVTRPKDNAETKVFDMSIMITDWQGAPPRKIAPGYALDVWKDPASNLLWVYAAQDVPPTHHTSWAAKKLIRFPLNQPSKVESVWDQTEVSPDNTQLSADGNRSSGQAPWPHGGQYLFEKEATGFMPTVTGCWAGMAPDNSYLSWMLDGSHRKVTLFTAAPEKKTWTLNFNEIKSLSKGEVYHPRWTNHAHFVALTGPYIAEQGGEGSIISKGGRTAEVVIAKLNSTVTGFEDSVTLTQNQNTDAYPDVWIAGGESAILSEFPQGLAPAANSQDWPSDTTQLTFLWEGLGKPNQVQLPTGKKLECYIEPEGSALFGPHLDMQLGSGSFRPNVLAQEHMAKCLSNTSPWSFEATLLPPSLPPSQNSLSGSLITLPGWRFSLDQGLLVINNTRLDHPVLTLPTHLVLRHDGTSLTVFINAKPLPALTLSPLLETTRTQFGGTPLPIGLKGIALYNAVIPDVTIQSNHKLWQNRISETLKNVSPRIRLRAKLTETTGIPTPEGIDPYTRAMIAYVYDVEQVIEGSYTDKQILVCHWSLMDRKPCSGFPRKIGESFELLVEPLDLKHHHPELEGQRVLDDTTAFDLEKWYDITPPAL